jgi:hypothetical protein
MFRKELPKIYALRDQIKDFESPDSCFRDFDNTLQDPVAFAAWETLENELQGLDSNACAFLSKEAAVYLTKWDGDYGRGREQVLNIINQARAYTFLRNQGCADIHFIPPCKKKQGVRTPDLQGALGPVKVICEVKTINLSKDGALRRQSNNYSDYDPPMLEQRFLDKLMCRIADAKEQIEAFDAENQAKHIVYIILNFDGTFGEYKENYFQQIDQHLCQNANAVSGLEIVFHNQHTTYFHRQITMKCATVVNDE